MSWLKRVKKDKKETVEADLPAYILNNYRAEVLRVREQQATTPQAEASKLTRQD